jgi:hypothetical protein
MQPNKENPTTANGHTKKKTAAIIGDTLTT